MSVDNKFLFTACSFVLFILQESVHCTPPPLAPVTKITTVLELFNPISLVKFFEYSDRGWNITGGCIRDMFWYLEAIEQDYLWPIKCEWQLVGYLCNVTVLVSTWPHFQ